MALKEKRDAQVEMIRSETNDSSHKANFQGSADRPTKAYEVKHEDSGMSMGDRFASRHYL